MLNSNSNLILYLLFFSPFLKVSQPFELVGMDIIGKVTETEAGNIYICVMVDYFTKWSEAFALPSKTAANVADCIVTFFLSIWSPKKDLNRPGTRVRQ